MKNNPLARYFRQPGVHVSLPSNGNYNPVGEIVFTSNNEVAIYPMTAADEIILNNPDSLLNGVALEKVITSCCPAVTNVNELPIPDVDVIILASKMVSYGDELKLVGKCPKCQQAKEFALSIEELVSKAKPLPSHHSVRLNDDLVAYLRPYTFNSNNKLNITQFEESKLIQNLLEDEIGEQDRSKALTDSFERITTLNLELLADTVIKISMPNLEVDNQNDIREFIYNSSRDVVKILKDGLLEFNKYGLPKETELTCDNEDCKNKWKTPVVYDPSSFFE